jgi:uncharacterized membrane protein YeiB
MGNGFLKYRKDRLSKWLLTLTVLFSIFALLPSVDTSKSQQQKAQTELVCSFTKSSLAKTVAYKNVNSSVDNNKKINNFQKYQTNSLLNYNRHIIVRLLSISKQFLKFENAIYFVQLKTIPKSSDEDNFISITG